MQRGEIAQSGDCPLSNQLRGLHHASNVTRRRSLDGGAVREV